MSLFSSPSFYRDQLTEALGMGEHSGGGHKRSGIQDHPWIHGELKASLGYIIRCLKKPEKKMKKPYTLIYKSIVTGTNLSPKCQGMGKCSQLLKIALI